MKNELDSIRIHSINSVEIINNRLQDIINKQTQIYEAANLPKPAPQPSKWDSLYNAGIAVKDFVVDFPSNHPTACKIMVGSLFLVGALFGIKYVANKLVSDDIDLSQTASRTVGRVQQIGQSNIEISGHLSGQVNDISGRSRVSHGVITDINETIHNLERNQSVFNTRLNNVAANIETLNNQVTHVEDVTANLTNAIHDLRELGQRNSTNIAHIIDFICQHSGTDTQTFFQAFRLISSTVRTIRSSNDENENNNNTDLPD